jgi:L-ascorbate 6-phosphate lactonase
MKTGTVLIKDIDNCKLKHGQLAFWWLGQLGYVVKSGNTVIYLDAFLSASASRNIPPMIRPEEVVNADFFFGSHDHTDHIDRSV